MTFTPVAMQMGLSGNLMILGVLYNGGMMMSESQITVGDLSAFLLYAAYVGVSIGGEKTDLRSQYINVRYLFCSSVEMLSLLVYGVEGDERDLKVYLYHVERLFS